MKLYEIFPYNKFLFYTGAILLFTGTYLDSTNSASLGITMCLLILGVVLMLLSLRKPKQDKDVA